MSFKCFSLIFYVLYIQWIYRNKHFLYAGSRWQTAFFNQCIRKISGQPNRNTLTIPAWFWREHSGEKTPYPALTTTGTAVAEPVGRTLFPLFPSIMRSVPRGQNCDFSRPLIATGSAPPCRVFGQNSWLWLSSCRNREVPLAHRACATELWLIKPHFSYWEVAFPTWVRGWNLVFQTLLCNKEVVALHLYPFSSETVGCGAVMGQHTSKTDPNNMADLRTWTDMWAITHRKSIRICILNLNKLIKKI